MATLRPVVVAGPSGSGKSTVIAMLRREFPSMFGFSVSHTSRDPRPGEIDGASYYFSNRQEMEAMRDRGEFIETAIYSGNMYGTSKRALEDVVASGRVPLLDIDLQGVRSVKRAGIDAKFIFLQPPSVEELERRLIQRGEKSENIVKRLQAAREELEAAQEVGLFDAIIINDHLDQAYNHFRSEVLAANSDSSL